MTITVRDEDAHVHRVSDVEREAIRRHNREIEAYGARPEADVAEWTHWHPHDAAHLSLLWHEHADT